MKKLFFLASAALLSLALNAQHVNPLNITLVEYDLAALRTENPDLTQYLAVLQHIRLDQDAVSNQMKNTEKELKEEQAHLKSLGVCIDESKSTMDNLAKLYQSEKKSLDALNKTYDKQASSARKSSRLEEETRSRFLEFLNERQDIIKDAQKDLDSRMRHIENLRPQVTQANTILQQFTVEIQQKELDLKQLQATHKARVEAVKAEVKNVEAQIKAAKKK